MAAILVRPAANLTVVHVTSPTHHPQPAVPGPEPSRLGSIWRTGSPADTRLHAATLSATYLAEGATVDALPLGGVAVLDLAEVGEAAAIVIGSRFRARGVSLAIAARPGVQIPDALVRNLADGV